MNSLYDLYLVYQGKRNIFGKLRISKNKDFIHIISGENGMAKRHGWIE